MENAVQTAPDMNTELARQAATWPIRAETLIIEDADTLNTAGEELLAVVALQAEAHARFDPICAATHGAWQEALKQRKIVLDPLDSAAALFKRSIAQYQYVQLERQRAEQRRLEAEAHARAEVKLEAEIEHAETLGATPAEVEAIIERPLQIAPVIAAPIVKPPAGISKPRDNWKGEITDKRALVTFIVNNNRWDLLALLTADAPACNGMAKSLKLSAAIPGVRFWNDPNIAVRRS